MNRDNLPWRPAPAAALEWSEDGAPVSARFGDVYYSREDGLQESRYVFLEGNGLPARWLDWPGGRFCIAETGFGTGLNFLLTWLSWRDTPEPRPDLHYLSVEMYPLAAADLGRALAAWPALTPLADELLAAYPGLVPGQHRLLFEGGRITLDLWWEDVGEALPQLAGLGQPLVDAWYLDGFAPARNSAMWQPAVLEAVARLSRPAASFSTFTAAGEVRRQLAGAGFRVARVPGFGRKRECLRGQLESTPTRRGNSGATSWDLSAGRAGESSLPPDRAIVIGAGLAGCSVAAALARRGVEVVLLERDTLAGGASGNTQGVLYTRPSPRHSALTDFSLQSFCFSAAFYRGLFASGALRPGLDGSLCGSFHQQADCGDLARLDEALRAVPEMATVLSAEAANALLGIEQAASGYWLPRSGWLHPGAVCRVLVRHPRISVLERRGEVVLEPARDGWRATDGAGQQWQAPCAIIATGTASCDQPMLDWLPLQAIRGQTSDLPASEGTAALRAVLCHEGYIAPARPGPDNTTASHCIGATFHLNDPEPTPRTCDHRSNLDSLGHAVPAWREALAAQDADTLGGRVGFRCASPDYLPLVGPVPDRRAFLQDFAGLRKNARLAITEPGAYLPGLYLSTAHGSRGLTSTPLAAELLASRICGEPPPLSRELSRALAPARFIIRDLCRNRI